MCCSSQLRESRLQCRLLNSSLCVLQRRICFVLKLTAQKFFCLSVLQQLVFKTVNSVLNRSQQMIGMLLTDLDLLICHV